MDFVRQNAALLMPIFIFWLVALVLGLRDLALRRPEEVTGGNKLVWRLVIVLISILGPILYFAFGRKRE